VPGDISARCLSVFAYPVKQNFASLHHPKVHCLTSPTAASGQPSRTAAAAAVLDQAVIYEDRLQINPGSASGSYSTFSKAVQPSFVLMDLDGSKVGHLGGGWRGVGEQGSGSKVCHTALVTLEVAGSNAVVPSAALSC